MGGYSHEDKYDGANWGGYLGGLLFLAGLLIGGLAGAGAMLLIAPQSGKKTRAQIRRKGRDLRGQTAESVEDAVAQVRTKAKRTATSLRKQAEDLQERGQAMLDEGGSRFAASR